jgi:hypothetical protein
MSFWMATAVLLWLMAVGTLLLLDVPEGATVEPTWPTVASLLAPPLEASSPVTEPAPARWSAGQHGLEPDGVGACPEARRLSTHGRPTASSDLRRRTSAPPLSTLGARRQTVRKVRGALASEPARMARQRAFPRIPPHPFRSRRTGGTPG